jgi:steroid Delta-isomerase
MADAATTIRRYYELVDAGDVDALVALFAPDIVYRRPGYPPIEGQQALRAFYEGERVIEEGRHSVTSLLSNGDEIAVEGTFAGRLRDGREVNLRFADFFSLEGRLIARRDTYFDAPLV